MDHCVAPPTSMYSMKRGFNTSLPAELHDVTKFIVVDTLHDNGVQFDVGETGLPNGFNAFEHPCMDIPPCQIPECLRPEGIQAHGDPMQPCVAKSLSLLSKKYPVSRESEVLDQGISASIRTSLGRSLRNSGSPPVRWTSCTPRAVKISTRRVISSNVKRFSRASQR